MRQRRIYNHQSTEGALSDNSILGRSCTAALSGSTTKVLLRAISAGVEVPTSPFHATVHSVFVRAFNFSVGSGTLVTVLSYEQQNLPRAFRVETPGGFDFRSRIRVGQQVVCDCGVALFAGGDLEIDLTTAQRWYVDVGALHCDLRDAGAYQAWLAAVSELFTAPRTHRLPAMLAGTGTTPSLERTDVARLLARRGRHATKALSAATSQRDAHRALRAASRLVGLGPGLTPSGDDLLVGFLAGLWSSAGRDRQRLAFLDQFGGGLSRLADGTGEVSRAYIASAICGHFSERLALLAGAIARGAQAPELRAVTQAALEVGATSGADGVLGLLAGLAAWSPRPDVALTALLPQGWRCAGL